MNINKLGVTALQKLTSDSVTKGTVDIAVIIILCRLTGKSLNAVFNRDWGLSFSFCC